jgi:hypothetical protein
MIWAKHWDEVNHRGYHFDSDPQISLFSHRPQLEIVAVDIF